MESLASLKRCWPSALRYLQPQSQSRGGARRPWSRSSPTQAGGRLEGREEEEEEE